MKKLILLTLLLTSCASRNSYFKEPTPEMKLAITQVANEYLGAITVNHFEHMRGMVLWTEYFAENSGQNMETIETQVIDLHEKFDPTSDAHPLRVLKVTDIKVNGNDAVVKLQKKGLEQPFDIELRWIGRGWLVVDDSIFDDYLKSF